MKTLYTGHVTIGTHSVYSFIYADTLLEAEEYLTSLLNRYVREHHTPTPRLLPEVSVVSRPQGWEPPDGYYLPATSAQYALRYHTHQRQAVAQDSSVAQQPEEAQSLELSPHAAAPSSTETSSRSSCS